MKIKQRLFNAIFLLFFVNQAFGQASFYDLTTLPLKDLNAFQQTGKNWAIVGDVSGNYTSSKLTGQSGTDILLNTISEKEKDGKNIFSKLEHGDIYLELDFMMPKGSNSGIYLQSRYEIQLSDSWSVKKPHYSDCGGIYERWDESKPQDKKGYEGHAPRVNASLAPGLWQHLQIEFQAPKFDKTGKKTMNAKFIKVILNGVIMHENVFVTGSTRSAASADEKERAPFMIQGEYGTVAFKNIKYALLGDFTAPVKDLSYEYYEGIFDNFNQLTPEKLTRKGKTDVIDYRLADNPNKMGLYFSGKLTVPETDNYQLNLYVYGSAKLEIDGKEVIPSAWYWPDNPPKVTLKLASGDHDFKIGYIKNFSWRPTALGFTIQKTNSRPLALHTPASVPEPDPVPLIEVQPGTEPELLRSFLIHNGKKLTHCISVGDPENVHFSYNLNQAGLLQTWKGNFLNTTDMWFERGEPQLASPMGNTVIFNGHSPVSIFSDDQNLLPDSLNDRTELIYQGYTFDNQRHPIFKYTYKDLHFTDNFTPFENGKGLQRHISISNPPANEKIAFRLGEGKEITEVEKGIFRLVNGTNGYYVKYVSNDGSKAMVKENKGVKELIVIYPAGNKPLKELSYILLW